MLGLKLSGDILRRFFVDERAHERHGLPLRAAGAFLGVLAVPWARVRSRSSAGTRFT